MLKRVSLILSGLCLIYGIIVMIATGIQIFNAFWFLAAAVFFIASRLKGKPLRILSALIVAGVFAVMIIEVPIIMASESEPVPDAEYVIVLGAKVDGTAPSLILRKRLDSAIDYYESSNGVKIAVTGGKGPDEGITEGECMQTYLMKHGIPEEDIVVEDKATNTYENLVFTGEIIGYHHKTVIVSSDFHLYRAKRLAASLGYTDISGKKADTLMHLKPQFYVREAFAVIKDMVFHE